MLIDCQNLKITKVDIIFILVTLFQPKAIGLVLEEMQHVISTSE